MRRARGDIRGTYHICGSGDFCFHAQQVKQCIPAFSQRPGVSACL